MMMRRASHLLSRASRINAVNAVKAIRPRLLHNTVFLRSEAAESVAKEEADQLPKTPKEPSEKVKRIAEEVMQLNLYESMEFVDYLKDKFGIENDAQLYGMGGGMMMPAGGMVAAAPAAAAPAEEAKEEEKPAEKTEFGVELKGFDAKGKIKVIKEIRAITGLGLKEAKELVEKAPVIIKEHLTKDEADGLAEKIKAAGGEVELK